MAHVSGVPRDDTRYAAGIKMTYPMISLFSGCGGLDYGLHAAGFTPVACCEIDPHARSSLKGWLETVGASPIIESDVTAVDPLALRRSLGLRKNELTLLAGGPPCQAFSLIGKRGSLNDDRGMLLFQMVRFAEEFQPKAVLVEQVKGLQSAPGFRGETGGALASLLARLRRLGYRTSHRLILAADYGVPQLRERLFVVAARERFVFPSPTHHRATSGGQVSLELVDLPEHKTVRQALNGLPRAAVKPDAAKFPNHVDVTPERDRERIAGVPEGQCLARQLHLPQELRQRLDPEKDTTKFRRLAWDQPSLTLRGGEAFYHPIEDRYLTPREYLRIHTFGDEYVLHGPVRARSGRATSLDQHRQVANAVPPRLAEVLGSAVLSQIQPRRMRKRVKAL